jgi:hypothetical protein
MSRLVLVDGSNMVNAAGRWLASIRPGDSSDLVQRYLRDWFDVDRFVSATIADEIDPLHDLGIVVFHTMNRLGPESCAWTIAGRDQLMPFWSRQGSNPSCSTMHVEVPGQMEKGLDMSMAVYLFETLERWQAAFLFTDDADFVPAVWSLRRHGKRVYCAALDTSEPRPLVLACQHFYPWDVVFLFADLVLFEELQPGGGLDRFLAHENVLPKQLSLRWDGGALLLLPEDEHNLTGYDELLTKMMGSECFRAVQHGNSLRVEPFMGGRSLETAVLVGEGLRRHADVLSKAAWHRLLVQD